MKTLIIATLLAIGIGFLLGVVRYVLDDKWSVLPKSLCRFCASFWCSWVLNAIPSAYLIAHDFTLTHVIVSYVLSVAVATGISAFAYVYFKNANT